MCESEAKVQCFLVFQGTSKLLVLAQQNWKENGKIMSAMEDLVRNFTSPQVNPTAFFSGVIITQSSLTDISYQHKEPNKNI